MAAKRGLKIPFPTGCLPRYLTMSFWKNKVFKKQNGSRTKSGRARMYISVPPVEGWPGGMPNLANGYKRSGK